MPQTTSQEPLTRSKAEISLEVTFAILICFASILGNLLVLYVINRYSEMQTITNIFIHNLALTDIFMATLNMPFWIISLYTRTWIFTREWCEVSASMQNIMFLASLLNMGLIALNRYIKVVMRGLYIKFFPSKRVAWLYCGVVWPVSMLFAIPPLYGWVKIHFNSNVFICTLNWKEAPSSFIILTTGLISSLTCATFYFYWKIYQTVKESTENVNANVTQNGVGAPRLHRADIKVLKSFFIVVCLFLITWGPPSLSAFLVNAGGYIPPKVLKVSVYLLFSSSVVNPIIYGIMNPQFKEAFKKASSCGRYGNNNADHADQSHVRHSFEKQ